LSNIISDTRLIEWEQDSWVQEAGGRHVRKVVQVRAASLRPLEQPGACQQVLRRVRGFDRKIGGAG
jgi:hypothetical protein